MKNLKREESDYMPDIKGDPRDFYEPVYTIGVAAAKLGVSVHTLRLYETEGLIIPYKTDSGRRLYSDLELEKVKCIKKMIQEEGLNFEGIRRLLAFVPCFKLRKCNTSHGAKCPAYNIKTRPCWATEEKCADPYPSCRDCPVYRKIVSCEDVQNLVYRSFCQS
ncbi:MAG TPA: MerR family transcriptional regulator [Spirochaetota bacterium]|nr:MerR family transcriptional regulator [Spirochaetota bacterium]HOK92042.1 MerR family transcriptional regulator [Spirochaetota bacterium]HON15821.1 MerR family transcriptional regulator [Spirochaetota bacterium]HPP94608.1 MerR family transcriptional regulator [Spirochaetota bacterium]